MKTYNIKICFSKTSLSYTGVNESTLEDVIRCFKKGEFFVFENPKSSEVVDLSKVLFIEIEEKA